MRYILASGSPRRKELLSFVVPQFEIIPAVSEEVTTSNKPSEIVKELSFQKASEIFHKILTDYTEDVVVIGADTIVSFNQRVLGKPKDRADAMNMIRSFQGQTHKVYTGVTIFYKKNGEISDHTFYEETSVDVEAMSDEEIASYVQTGEPDDKAGAYGLQGIAGMFIEKINGNMASVIGLPTYSLYKILKKERIIDLK